MKGFSLGVALLAAGGCLAASAQAVTLAAPASGSVIGEPRVVLSGRAEGAALNVTVNGKDLPSVTLRNGVFSVPVVLQAGTNRLELTSGPEKASVTLEYRAGGGTYRFHPGYAEGECGECHEQEVGRIATGTHSALCHGCHDSKDQAAFLHGPVAAGQCGFCHDPHGSVEKAFLTRGSTALCGACHDQSESRKHMAASSGKDCTECHNPHGSEKEFFLY